MRRLNRKRALSLVRELDAFPKVPESYVETSAVGGAAYEEILDNAMLPTLFGEEPFLFQHDCASVHTVSLIVLISMALLTIFEFFVYQDTWIKYEYEVDKDFSSKLRINIDITVAMECQWIGVDVLDRANTMIALTELKYERVNFELSPLQRLWQKELMEIQSRLREEHSLQDVLFRDALKSFHVATSLWSVAPSGPLNACRMHGHVYVNKVEGNLHFTLGPALHYSGAHTHFGAFIVNDAQNYSHRIDHLSFGEAVAGLINPLDATEKITLKQNQQFQYFVTVVPTKLHTSELLMDTHQYSVTEQERVINHTTGDHGASGIFVKYTLNPLMVRVREEHMPLGTFLVRMCGIIGGIFSTSDLLHRLAGLFVDVICCRLALSAREVLPQSQD